MRRNSQPQQRDLWLEHWRDEVDAAFLYRRITAAETDAKRSKDFGPLGVRLRSGDASVEKGGIDFVAPMLEPQISLLGLAVSTHVLCWNSELARDALPGNG